MKILPTIGPETIKLKNLKFLLSRSDFVRLNSSHNSIIWHKNAIKKIKKKAKITNVAFDRSGYRYHGRVKAVAEALRDKGVKI